MTECSCGYASDEEKMVGTKAEQVRVAVGDMAESELIVEVVVVVVV